VLHATQLMEDAARLLVYASDLFVHAIDCLGAQCHVSERSTTGSLAVGGWSATF